MRSLWLIALASLSVGSSRSQSSNVTLLACTLVRVVITVAIVAPVAIIISSVAVVLSVITISTVTPLSLSIAAHTDEDPDEHEEGQQVPVWFFTRVVHLFVYLLRQNSGKQYSSTRNSQNGEMLSKTGRTRFWHDTISFVQ